MNRPTPISTDQADTQTPSAGEALSALADGELTAAELAALWQGEDAEQMATWGRYQLIGEALRAGAALPADAGRVATVMQRLRTDSPQVQPERLLPVAVQDPLPQAQSHHAANDEVFRWKMLAGFAAVAAAAAVIWNVTLVAPGAAGPQLAQAPSAPAPATTLAAADSGQPPPVLVPGQQGPILRDPRLEELMAAHRQAGGMSALQMPAGFLRNATFELPGGER